MPRLPPVTIAVLPENIGRDLTIFAVSDCDNGQKRYHVTRDNGARRRSGLLHKEMSMSREDDFDDIIDSPDEVDAGEEDTSDILMDESSESPVETIEAEIETYIITTEPELPAAAPAREPAAKKKKAASKPTAKKKKAAKPARKPAAKKTTAKKPAKKKVAKKTAKKPAKKIAKKVATKKVAKKKTRPAPKKKARRKR